MESLAFIDHRSAVDAMLALAAEGSPARGEAMNWLLRQGTGEWRKYNLARELKETGVYDPDKIRVSPVTVPDPPRATLPPRLKR